MYTASGNHRRRIILYHNYDTDQLVENGSTNGSIKIGIKDHEKLLSSHFSP